MSEGEAAIHYLETMFVAVGDELLSAYRRTETPDEPGIIFPFTRGGSVRISEQEAKTLFLYQLCSGPYRFSVETPTCESHGTGRSSARVDVSIFKSGREIKEHLEFKEGNGDLEGIRTSLEKLIREGRVGGWFHTLESANSGTLSSLTEKIIKSFNLIIHILEESEPHECLFAFCIIRKRRLFLRWVTLGGEHSFEQCETAFRDLCSPEPSSWKVYELEDKMLTAVRAVKGLHPGRYIRTSGGIQNSLT